MAVTARQAGAMVARAAGAVRGRLAQGGVGRGIAVAAAFAAVALFVVPAANMPAFYESFLYIICFWIALATSWNIFSGYAHYLSFGHSAFFGIGVYTTAVLTSRYDMAFLWSLPIAFLIPAAIAAIIGVIVFRLEAVRAEMFALLTLALAFIAGSIVLNTAIDGGSGIFLYSVPLPAIAESPTTTIYLLGAAIAVATVLTGWLVYRSRFGLGLLAIHDDEHVAEVKGVPTFRYKIAAFALSAGIAGIVGGNHALFVGYVTVGETFGIMTAVYVVLMCILGGMRHWLGPPVGAAIIAASLYAFTGGEGAVVGRGIVGFALMVVIIALPAGVVPSLLKLWRRRRPLPAIAAADPATIERPAAEAAERLADTGGAPLLDCIDVHKSFGGVHALRGASLDVRKGEILGLVGPNGSGKTTLMNVISGHYRVTSGVIRFEDQELQRLPAHVVANRGISRTYQIPRPLANMTVLENVALAATFGGVHRDRHAARADAAYWLAYTGIGERANTLPGDLNLHERKFLELARALAARPRLLLLDEVLSGLNPSEVEKAVALVRAIHAQGTTIIFIEHLMRAVVELSDRIAVMNEGTVFAIGKPKDVMNDPEVIRIYLGSSHAA